jgi:hypothetical protein
MNKQQLLEEVNKLPDDVDILSSKDDEGNGYRWINGISLEYIDRSEDSGWEVESVMTEEDIREDGYTDDEIEKVFKRVAVIW